ncbi:MAG TPA: peptidylprolyl isomerase, partial [Nannocystis sp.]
AASVAVLADDLTPDDPVELQEAAAFSIGRLGRRKVALDEATRTRLAKLRAPELAEYYALANNPAPPGELRRDLATALLTAGTTDIDPTVRRLAYTGLLARYPAQTRLGDCIVHALHPRYDDDAFAFQADISDEQALTLLQAWGAKLFHLPRMNRRGELVTTRIPPPIDPSVWPDGPRRLLAGLACLAAAKPELLTPARREHLVTLRSAAREADARVVAETKVERPLSAMLASHKTLAQLDCRLAQLLARGPAWRPPLTCASPGDASLLEPAILAAGFGGPDRLARLDELLRTRDPAVQIAAITAAATLWDDPAAAKSVQRWLLAALDAPTLGVIGAAADAITARHKQDAPPPITADDPLWRTLARRARGALAHEPELYATLVATLAATRVPAGVGVCEPGLRHANYSVREAARACIKALRGADPGPQAPGGPQAVPPVDPGRLAGQRVLWTLTTEYGDLKIDLDPDAAPWAVATIVALTGRGFYDGLSFHRDVPGFVLQGGDPEGTGWGGPGFVLPSEPSHHRFDRGAVGIADAGKDTGGSQFFFMHDRAPHLEGRYTWVGQLRPGQHGLLPLLTVGDRILKATVKLRPPRARPR